jgi:UDP-N-acetylmuramate-alanine ligase
MKYHFIGIGGIGMSALARILLKRGAQVQGTDSAVSYVTEGLQKAGAEIYSNHSCRLSQKSLHNDLRHCNQIRSS